MPSVIVTQPQTEPVTLAEAKLHLRLDTPDDDPLVTSLITASRQQAEAITRRAFITQTWRQAADLFPAPDYNVGSANWYGPQWGSSPGPITTLRLNNKTGYEIYLDHSPVKAVQSITYTDQDGVIQTLPPTAYKLDLITEPCRILPAYGTTWPATRNEINSVVITYICGYGAATDVPESIKSWMKLRMGAMYENREEIATGRGITAVEMPFVDGLLHDYRVQGF